MKNYELDEKCGKRLAECMKQSKINEKELALKVAKYYAAHGLSATKTMSQQKISTIVKGRVHLKKEDAELFADILDVDVNYLLGKTKYRTPMEKISEKFGSLSEREQLYYQIIELHGYKLITTVSDLEEITTDSFFINQWIIEDEDGKTTSLHHINPERPRILFLYDTKSKKLSPPILMSDFRKTIDDIDYYFRCCIEKPFRKYQEMVEYRIPIKRPFKF